MKNREANLGEFELPVQDATFTSHATLTILFGIIFCLGCLLRTTGAPCGRGAKYPHCSSRERGIYPTPVIIMTQHTELIQLGADIHTQVDDFSHTTDCLVQSLLLVLVKSKGFLE